MPKFVTVQNYEVAEAGWRIRFQTAKKEYGGDGSNHFLSVSSNGQSSAKFSAVAQTILLDKGDVSRKREFMSIKDGAWESVLFNGDADFNYVRFNITFVQE
ncbi:Oidioi.mRNA.OKI2018_I69.chr1.g684.t1.cds [Oikopleura dioica]|uniref:Oidioi.mRNA.OKI2018_I69.chr1.g684.t1.cds n=1 Tax=Oikopleura dioica TaxID=34765 RepID=A0ABN7SQS3_OIKDI|nr:Oidioi.mRNA.OKI2018_I69.chr1.g684.t1.cds [Oikopleura dioica]